MRIGIVSFYDTQHNYGQVLQCYALQQFLIKLGHTPEHIKCPTFLKSKASIIGLLSEIALHGLLPSYAKYVYDKVRSGERRQYSYMQGVTNNIDRGFDKFRSSHIAFSKYVKTYKELATIADGYDALVAGSDQIWRGPSKQYCLGFGSKGIKRIAYAASMGGTKVSYRFQKYLWRKYLKRFDYISLRELSGVKEIQRLGYPQAKLVLDPTFLLTANEYIGLLGSTRCPAEDYVFLYLLGNPIDLDVSVIYQWAASKGLKVIYVASQGRQDDYEKRYASIEEWMSLINGARYVITNSFHGMVFSIIFQKQFLVIPLTGYYTSMNSRISDTLQRLNICNRIFSNGLDAVCDPIDYADAVSYIESHRETVGSDISTILCK